jgi:putative membrane-bound dehydrogenase-like protein
MRRFPLLAALLVAAALLALAGWSDSQPKKGDGWIPLFNGKDLDGWSTYFEGRGKDGKTDDLVRVEDGVIHFYPTGTDGDTRPTGYLATAKAYSYYQLRFEYRWGGKRFAPHDKAPRAAGLMYHAVSPDRLWPRGLGCRVEEGHPGDLETVAGTRVTTTVDPRRPRAEADRGDESTYLDTEQGGTVHTQGDAGRTRVLQNGGGETDGWNQVEVIVKGGSTAHVVNGKVVNRATDIRQLADGGAWVPLTAGRLLLRAEGAEVLYRNIAIKPVWGGPLEVSPGAAAVPAARPFAAAPLEVPEGFTAELVAGPPLVTHPMMACFDDAGRLFVAESAGLNLEAHDLELVRPNSIRLLTDADGDGKFDRAVTFADRLTFPMGVAWKDGALYVASPPYVWRFRDTDGDGVADERTELVGRFNDSGIGDSLHGTVFGPDGRLYWVHGIGGGGHEVRDPDGRLVVKSRAPGIFSCWPDGRDVRKHCAGGMNNPVELDFTDAGQAVGTVNLLWGNPRNDALVQWAWGGAYTNNEHLIADVKRTGDLLGPTYSFGHAALSGLTRLRSRALGDDYQDSFLVAEFNTQHVRRVRLTPAGSTYTGAGSDFVSSPNRDVHFTDVLEDADGSVLVIDTGGWFRNGCPESQVAKPDIPGGIYRIRRKDQPRVDDSRGHKITWQEATAAELLRLLDDERFVVRDRADDVLARRGDAVVPDLEHLLADADSSRRARLNAVWALCRMPADAARAASRRALGDRDATVREAAAHAVFCHRDRAARPALLPLLADASPSVRREAATALGTLHDATAVPALLKALAGDNDRLLEHALTYALIEIDDRAAVLPGLADASPRVRRAALIALDQMDGGDLTSDLVLPLLGTGDLALERTALGVVSRHKGWAGEITDALGRRLAEPDLPAGRLAALRGVLVALGGDVAVQRRVSDTLAAAGTPQPTRLLLLDVMAGSELKDWPESWGRELEKSLRSGDPREVAQAVAAAAASRLRRFDTQLEALAADAERPRAVRVAAAVAVAGSGRPVRDEVFRLLIDECGDKAQPVERLAAARALVAARLDAAQLRRVAGLLARADPLLLPVLADALEKGGDAETGRAMVAALEKAPGLGNLSPSRLDRVLAAYPPEVRRSAEPLLKRLRATSERQAERLEQLKGLVLEGGDPRKGRQVFRDPRALCLSCHRIGNEGESIGPDLSGIGSARTRADLLEAIVLPSASFARGFEPYVVSTAGGKLYTGLIARQTGEAVYLRTADRAEVRIPRAEIEEIAAGRESIMPQGLDRVLTTEELRDLLAYLSSLRDAPR